MIIELLSFLFGGFAASFLISLLFYKLGIKKEIRNLQKQNDKRLINILSHIINKMQDSGTPYSIVHEKKSYTQEEVDKIFEKTISQILTQRNIQLQQFIEDAIREEN